MAARDEDPELNEPPSKSQRKRDAEELKDLGDELTALPATDLEALPLPEKLRDAIDLARRITAHGAAARQRQLIGKILRKVDVEEIRAALEARALARRLEAREFHRVEAWRDRLLAEGEPALAALAAAAPGFRDRFPSQDGCVGAHSWGQPLDSRLSNPSAPDKPPASCCRQFSDAASTF